MTMFMGIFVSIDTHENIGDRCVSPSMSCRVLSRCNLVLPVQFIAMPLTIVGSSFSSSWDKIKTKVAADRAHDLQQEDEWVVNHTRAIE